MFGGLSGGCWQPLEPDPLTDVQLAYYTSYHTANGFGIRGVEWSKNKLQEFDTTGVGPESAWASAWETLEGHIESSCKHCKKQQQQRHKRKVLLTRRPSPRPWFGLCFSVLWRTDVMFWYVTRG